MDAKTDSPSTDSSIEDPFSPDLGADMGPSIESETSSLEIAGSEVGTETDLDPDTSSRKGVGERLRGIERDSLVSMEAARNGGLAVLVGSTGYINFVHRDVADAVKEAFPNSEVDNYVIEELEELSDLDLPDVEVPEYGPVEEGIPEELSDLDLPDYASIDEELPFDTEAVSDEIVHHLNKEVTDLTQFEGIDSAESVGDVISQVSMDNLPDIFLTSFDQLAHGMISGTAANITAGTVDRFTEGYDPKKVAVGGMSTALAFALVKEGIYEGGPGMQFDLQSMDVQGDFIMDTLGAAYGTWSYHKNKTQNEETDPGLVGKAARKTGRAYEKARYMARGSLPSWRAQRHKTEGFGSPDLPERSISSDQLEDLEVVVLDYDLELDESKQDAYEDSEDYMPEQALEGETISVKDSYEEEPQVEIRADKSVEEMLEPSASSNETGQALS